MVGSGQSAGQAEAVAARIVTRVGGDARAASGRRRMRGNESVAKVSRSPCAVEGFIAVVQKQLVGSSGKVCYRRSHFPHTVKAQRKLDDSLQGGGEKAPLNAHTAFWFRL